MTDRIIRIAQVGYGRCGSGVMAQTLWDLQRDGIAPDLERLGLSDLAKEFADVQFKVVAVGARTAPSANRAVEENDRETGNLPYPYYGIQPWVYALRDNPEVDALVVATPDHLHHAPVMEALEAGVHVIVEKPLCLNANEADDIIATAARKGLIVGVDVPKRYDPDHTRIVTELAADPSTPIHARGLLEEPVTSFLPAFPWVEQSDPFTYIGVHWVDLLMRSLQLTPRCLHAAGRRGRLYQDFGRDAFDSVQVVVAHSNGLNVVYDNDWVTAKHWETSHVQATDDSRLVRYSIDSAGSRECFITCMETICRVKFLGATASELAGTYPDASSQRVTTAIVHVARDVMRRNAEHTQQGKSPDVTARFGANGITVHDPHTGEDVVIYEKEI